MLRARTDSAGSITDTYTYSAFGQTLSHTGTTVNSYQYIGQQLDSLTGLYSLRARAYDPTTGRFLSQDTAGITLYSPLELNRYAYTAGNPINRTDPSGHQAFVEYSKANSQAEAEDSAVAEEGGSLAQDAYDNVINDSIEDLNAVDANDPAAQNPARIDLAKTSGHWGEQQFANANPDFAPKEYFDTPDGKRVFDFFDEANQVAHEVKTGYQSLSTRISQEIAKDAEMLANEDVKDVVWDFYRSPINGKIGASQPLLDLLAENGIKVIIH